MIKKKIFIATAVFASICMLGGCATSKSSKKAAEATTEAAQQAKATPVKLNASEYVKLGQYKGLTIKGASTKVTDQDVEDQVNELAHDNASYEEIKDRKTVQKDDYLNVDYTTTINGKENSDYSDSNLDMHLGDGNLNVDENVDVDEKLIGAKVGDTVTIEFTFPEDYDDSSIAGKKCELAVSINMIEKEVIPEVNDALVKENTDCKTVKEYKKEVKELLQKDAELSYEYSVETAVWEKVMENTEVKKYPEKELKETKENWIKQYQTAAEYYQMEYETFVEEQMGMTVEDFEKQIETAVKDTIKEKMAVEAIADKEKIKLDDKTYKKELKNIVSDYGYESVDALKEAVEEKDLKKEALKNVVIEKLAEKSIQVKSE